MSPRDTDARLLRRAAWSVSIQTALAVAFVVIIVSLGVVLVFDRQQAVEITASVRHAATTADDVADPPDGVWLVLVSGTTRTSSTGTPDVAAALPILATAPSGEVALVNGDEHWTAWVDVRATGRFVAIYDQSRHSAEEDRLLVSTTVAGIVGVVLAAVIGLFVGRRAVRPLGRALTLQRRFVADASHELRTPLAVLHTRAQLLRRQLTPGDPAISELDQLVSDTRVLGEVVADLLLSAQLEHAPVAGQDVDVPALAEDVVRSLRDLAGTSEVSLTLQDPTDDVGTLHVSGAPTAIRRALLALVDNAIAHSPSGGSVSVGVSRAGGDVRLSVRDDGEGIGAADAARLTDRFARGTTGSGGGRRFGLGLALVDEIVRAHAGRLDVESGQGPGSTFILVLPARDETPRVE